MNKKLQTGFTLLEILIALFIFTIMSIIATTSLYQVFQTKDKQKQHFDNLSELQIALSIVKQDLEQIIDRPVLDNEGSRFKALTGTNSELQFTRTGYVNPFAIESHSNLQRVGYKYVDQELVRQTWPVLDRAPKTKLQERVLFKNVTNLVITYYVDLNKNYAFWPPSGQFMNQSNVQQSGSNNDVFPKAIEIKLEIQDIGQIQLMVPVNANSLKFKQKISTTEN